MDFVILTTAFVLVAVVMIAVILRQGERMKAIESGATVKVKAAEEAAASLRTQLADLDAENERLDRENFRLDLVAKLQAQYGVCEGCRSKDKTLRDDQVPPKQRQRLRNIVLNE